MAAAYNFAEHLPERRAMMQRRADYLDKLKAGAEVVAMPARGPLDPTISFVAPSPRLIPEGKNRVPLPGWRGSQLRAGEKGAR